MKFITKFALVVCVCIAHFSYSQKEANIWYFGNKAGLDFNSGEAVAITDGQMDTQEGCASVADEEGNLLFYTDGTTVWNKNHKVMSNGTGLKGGISSTQSAIIMPKPLSTYEYYIFTVDENAGPEGLSYTEVDMTASNGLGSVSSNKNVRLMQSTCEKLTAVVHSNKRDIWVITHGFGSNEFAAFLVTPNGVLTTPVLSNSGVNVSGEPNKTQGYMKSSTDGKRLALAHNYLDIAQLFDFDNFTGIVSNPITLSSDYEGSGPYGVEFSPFGNALYITEANEHDIYQYDLNAIDIPGSETIIGSVSSDAGLGGMQVAPDGQIYVSIYGSINMGLIHSPDSIGTAANFDAFGVDLLGKFTYQGVPSFVQSYFVIADFEYENTCKNDSTNFNILAFNFDSLHWDFGDTNSIDNFSNSDSAFHVYSDTGTFNAELILFYNDVSDTTVQTILIKEPNVYISLDSGSCIYEEEIPLKANTRSFEPIFIWSNASEKNIINTDNEGIYWVELTSQECSISDTIEVLECEIVFDVPNIFTPNGDNHNDFLTPIHIDGVNYLEFIIYNRWGEEVHQTENLLINWNGEELVDGVYFWTADFIDARNERHFKKGNITILR